MPSYDKFSKIDGTAGPEIGIENARGSYLDGTLFSGGIAKKRNCLLDLSISSIDRVV